MSEDDVDARLAVEIADAVAVITIDRREKRNALDAALVRRLREVCEDLDATASVRAVVVTGVEKAFCAGGDIDAWGALSAEEFARRWIRDGHAAFDALARMRQPVIAALNGHALGGGLELAACADLRIAEAHVKIGQPEPGLGVVAGWSGAQRAARRFGAQAVRRMALFGEIFDAETAHAMGLVDQVVPTGESLDAARGWAAKAAARAPIATEITKMAINAAEGEERERALDALAGGWAASTQDLREGLAAFREKRPARFQGR